MILNLTHWGRVTHICVGNLTIICSDNGLSPDRRQAITWTNVGILLIGPLGTNFSEMLIEIQHIFIQENAFENVVRKFVILSRSQCVNEIVHTFVTHSFYICTEIIGRGNVISCFHNTLRLRQNGRHFADDIFKRIFLNENDRIWIKISLEFLPNVPINNIPSLVQIMAWCRPGDKPLSEPMVVWLPTHICFARPQWCCTYRVNMRSRVSYE